MKEQTNNSYVVGYQEKRPWGAFKVLATGHSYTVKEITVDPGHKLSFQLHHHRNEVWSVVSGVAVVTLQLPREELEVFEVKDNTPIYIPVMAKHRVMNPSTVKPLVFVEVQTGEFLDENDIVRLEDPYNREVLRKRSEDIGPGM